TTATPVRNSGHTVANATTESPTTITDAAIITLTRAEMRSNDRSAIRTPGIDPAKWTLMVAPATGRLTSNLRTRCSSNGPYDETTSPIKRNAAAIPPIATGVTTM